MFFYREPEEPKETDEEEAVVADYGDYGGGAALLGDTWASAPLIEGVASGAPIPAVSDVEWTTAPGN